jgi:formiminotetrahydrofolate cyclodeaminase
MLTNRTVTELLSAFSSPDPTPGGGSAAALAGAMGASLLAMVAGLPKTRSGTPEERAALDRARAELLDLRRELTGLVDRDTDAYDLVVAAYRKPKATDEEKAARQAAIQDAMRVATDVPAETMAACARAVTAARAVAECGLPSAKSDVAVGVQLLMTAMQGALYNVAVNIGSLKDPVIADRIVTQVQATLQAPLEAVHTIYTTGGVRELMEEAARRFGGAVHGQPPPDVPPHVLVPPAMQLLQRIGTAEARQALEAFARSANEATRTAASAALSKFDA